ncbi:hypothetical protein B0F87_104245 [Methylobacter tundripaludum]|uniref:Limiting CO2-inducible protein B/C beta carbonyic anhydrase domain-containing protein n=1 Tax=Methylobacter tundripaludum TaxID=173365 RepID=A0A2S6HFI0_9GAMM|nr:hypothetical protein [Methylobacter tundripaludum]PPK76153.1 hypothetical protein B0F87_104245 [Methylobacter tundripaludum]
MKNSYLETIREYYPNANYSEILEKEVIAYLEHIGFNPDKVMTANSICSDDINAMQFPISDSGLLGPFYLGGLDGFPFTGLTGVQAFAHHMPEEGALLIYYGPHIGITEKGEIGKVVRNGQDHESNCCGAAQAALARINDQPQELSLLDYQEDTIVQLFQKNKIRIEDEPYPIQEATEVMFEAIQERIHLLITKSKDEFVGKYLILIGSIFINVDEGAASCIAYKEFQTTNLYTNEVTDHLEGFVTYLAKNNLG